MEDEEDEEVKVDVDSIRRGNVGQFSSVPSVSQSETAFSLGCNPNMIDPGIFVEICTGSMIATVARDVSVYWCCDRWNAMQWNEMEWNRVLQCSSSRQSSTVAMAMAMAMATWQEGRDAHRPLKNEGIVPIPHTFPSFHSQSFAKDLVRPALHLGLGTTYLQL